jgi:hypothetical protein
MSVVDPTVVWSQIGAAVEAMYLLLKDRGLPEHPVTGEVPQVLLGWDPMDSVAEYVTVVTSPEQTLNEWARMGPAGRDEEFVIDVLVRSQVPAEFDELQAWHRITDLVVEVQKGLYRVSDGKPVSLGFPNERRTGRAQAVDQRLELVDSSWVGRGIVRTAHSARI